MSLQKIRDDLRDFSNKYKGHKVGILYGELSYEDKAYIRNVPKQQASGAALYNALGEMEFLPVFIDPNDPNLLGEAKKCSLIFNNLHGEFGEDGAVQALFKHNGIKYTGSYILAHALGLNKSACKLLAKGLGIKTPGFHTIYSYDNHEKIVDSAAKALKLPWVIKPLHGGTSVKMELAHSEAEALIFCGEAKNYDSGVLIEEYIEGIDLTVGILEMLNYRYIMPPLKIGIDSAIYDERMKLKEHWSGKVHYECPANIDHSLTTMLQKLSLQVYLATQCSGFARIDWRVSNSGTSYFLEINTNPGISKEGNFALGAKAMGLTYNELVRKFKLISEF